MVTLTKRLRVSYACTAAMSFKLPSGTQSCAHRMTTWTVCKQIRSDSIGVPAEWELSCLGGRPRASDWASLARQDRNGQAILM